MRRLLARHYRGARLLRLAVLVAISLTAISASRSSTNTAIHPIADSDSWRMRLPFRLESNIADIEKYATAQVQPAYPETAQKYRIEGTVRVLVEVNTDGKVIRAEFKQGHTVFRSVSLEAARQWQFKSPDNTDMEGTLTFTFKLKS